MDDRKVPRRSATASVAGILDSPEFASLIADIDALRVVGRKGYGTRALLGGCLVKHIFALPNWTRVADLIGDHEGLQRILGAAPSHWALCRFAVKLRAHKPLMDALVARMADALREEFPGIGTDVAIDASDLVAYANGQRYIFQNGPERQVYSDPDASWGHRSAVGTRSGGSFYGYKLDMAVCSATGLPLAWQVRTARRNESLYVAPLIDAVRARGYEPRTVAMDRGYDNNRVMDETRERGCVPIVALRKGRPIPLLTIPYGSPEWKGLYHRRVAVEREFGRLKHEFGIAPLRHRGLARVQLHADLCILTRLGLALTRARAVSLAA